MSHIENSNDKSQNQNSFQNPDFLKKGFYSIITSIINIFAGLFQFIMFSRFLSTELYGIFNQIMMITQLFMFVILFGTDMTLKQLLPPKKMDKERVFTILSNIIFLEFLGFLIVLILFLGFPNVIEILFLNDSFLLPYFPVLVGLIFIFSLGLLSEFILHVYYKFKQILYAYLIFSGILISTISLTIITGPSLLKILICLFSAFGAKTLISFILCLKNFKNLYGTAHFFSLKYIKMTELKKILKIYSLFGFLLIADNVLRSFDKIYISANLSTVSYAIYSFYYAIAFMVAQLTFNIRNFLNPYVREHQTNKSFYLDLSTILIKFSTLITGGVIAFKWIILQIIPNPDYQSNTLILDLLLISFYLYSINLISQTLIFSKGKHVIYIVPILFSLIVIYLLNIGFVNKFGLIIPPIAMIISYSFMTLFYGLYLFRFEKIQIISFSKIFYLLLLILIIIIPNVFIQILIFLLFFIWTIISEKGLVKWFFSKK